MQNEDINELIGLIIDIFEDFLEEKGIEIANPEKEDDDVAILYGTDYFNLEDQIKDTLIKWKLI